MKPRTDHLQLRNSRNALIVLMCDKYIKIDAFVNTFLLDARSFAIRAEAEAVIATMQEDEKLGGD